MFASGLCTNVEARSQSTRQLHARVVMLKLRAAGGKMHGDEMLDYEACSAYGCVYDSGIRPDCEIIDCSVEMPCAMTADWSSYMQFHFAICLVKLSS